MIQRPKKSKLSRLMILAAFIVVAILGYVIGEWQQSAHPIALKHGAILSQPVALQPFELTDQQGREFTNKSLKGHWSLVFFGFTHCPGICPTTLTELNQAYRMLQQQNVAQLPKILFVSIDPRRDSPDKIKQYVTRFNPQFSGVTGNQEELDTLTREVSIMYTKTIQSNVENYDINHSNAILVIDPNGRWVGLLSAPHKSNNIVNNFIKIQKHFNRT